MKQGQKILDTKQNKTHTQHTSHVSNVDTHIVVIMVDVQKKQLLQRVQHTLNPTLCTRLFQI